MKCLLCQTDGTALAPYGDHWTATCPRCGRYRFDTAFGELVRHANANHDGDVLEQIRRLAVLVRRSPESVVIRRQNVIELLDRAKRA